MKLGTHDPREVAYEFERAYAFALDVGYTQVMCSEQRKAVPVDIRAF